MLQASGLIIVKGLMTAVAFPHACFRNYRFFNNRAWRGSGSSLIFQPCRQVKRDTARCGAGYGIVHRVLSGFAGAAADRVYCGRVRTSLVLHRDRHIGGWAPPCSPRQDQNRRIRNTWTRPGENDYPSHYFFFISGLGFSTWASRIADIQHRLGLNEAELRQRTVRPAAGTGWSRCPSPACCCNGTAATGSCSLARWPLSDAGLPWFRDRGLAAGDRPVLFRRFAQTSSIFP